MNNKPKTKKWKQWMSRYMKSHPNSGQFKKGHKSSKKTLLKLSKSLIKAHKLFPDKWKRTEKERKLMSLRMKIYIKKHPEFVKKRIEEMIKANKIRIYPKRTKKEIIKFIQAIKNYLKTHTVWNKGLKIQSNTGRTHFKRGHIPYNIDLPSYLQPAWKGGISKKGYPLEFNDKLKLKIRKRDNYTC